MNKLTGSIQRTFVVGDEWLYYKLYCGPKTADEVLTQVIKPVTEELIKANVIDKWFFIRYADPNTHLRVRFHYTKPDTISIIINKLGSYLKPFIEQDLINKVQVDTYQRELERYGRNSMELAEDLFYYDSNMIVNFIDLIEGDEGEEIRWLFSLNAIDSLLDNFLYTETDKFKLLEILKEGFGREFGMNRLLKMQLDKKFRNNRQKINDILRGKYGNEDISGLTDLLNQKSEYVRRISLSLLSMEKGGILERPVNELLGSYIHMLMNRLFKSKQRLHEMVVYDFLYRYYKSEIAKLKHNPQLAEAQ